MNKSEFVQNFLRPLMLNMNYDITDVAYEETHSEIVTVVYKNGSKVRINVTGDSYAAIVFDVWRKIY